MWLLLCRVATPVTLTGLTSLRHLRVAVSSQLAAHGWAGLTSLQWLDIRCGQRSLPQDLQHHLSSLTGLRNLRLLCSNQELPGISSLRQLTTLTLSGCQGLQRLPGLGQVSPLVQLHLARCSRLERLPDSISCLSRLTCILLSW